MVQNNGRKLHRLTLNVSFTSCPKNSLSNTMKADNESLPAVDKFGLPRICSQEELLETSRKTEEEEK
jgi:hypothetical protein